MRTLLQSLDAARYQEDDELDRAFDISQARTDVLMAVIFGRKIVVPAGFIADSPGFQIIFSEVITALEASREKLYSLSSYRPFSLGLDHQFQNYDDFVRDYVDRFLDPETNLVVLGDIAKQQGVTNDQLLAFMSKAYLERKFFLIEQHGGPGLFFNRIAREFGEGNDCSLTVTHGNIHRPYSSKREGLALPLRAFLERTGAQFGDLASHKELSEGLEAIEKTSQGLGLRGTWYKNENRVRFGDTWDLARIWLDYSLNQEFITRYGVHVPSLFLQEIEQDKYPVGLTLGFASDGLVKAVETGEQGSAGLSGATNKVDWDRIWEIVASSPFQNSLRRMNSKIKQALDNEQRSLASAEEHKDTDIVRFTREVRDARKGRQAAVQDAMDQHIDTVLADLPDYAVENKLGKIFLRLKQQANEWTPKNAIAGFAVQKAAPAAVVSVTPTLFLASMGMPEAAINTALTTALGGVGMATAEKIADHTIGKVMRPTLEGLLGLDQANIDKHIDHMNFWIGASYVHD
ncbi:hypothetical protein [Parasphingopyxis sp.]|uniref:hypothetical protein n=1 Tax=Parasphingopyxis sp. TaxID=1920299 RepID=UPI002636C045|nr:hypothetical protein [Parasphingopyxis sp.]